jgi:capsular polysaccharide biosynthesis protein
MLPESFAFPHTRENWKRRSVVKFFVNNYVLRKRRRFKQKSVWVTDDWSNGYFHWLGDVIPRLFTVKDQLKDRVLLLPNKYQNFKYVTPSLQPFELGGVEFVKPAEVLVCDDLILPTQTAPSGHYNDELIRAVAKMFVDFYRKTSPAATDRIYISRSRAPKRKIINEAEVIALMKELGFRIVLPEELSFAEQVTLGSQARYLVSSHGAGMTNMLFMPPATSVLELRHVTDNINNCYFTLASALGLNYYYQTCKANGTDPHLADLVVDIDKLRTNLELMMR